ncbi:MAG: hypothetical protein FIA93_12100 [Deltaproteobacteria bacterium]|nr:hypothetical protein [Deltaproteobacteria bacterium]PWB63822.1 MAG: hypothetical protein C3F14_07580 [Deltaproteobacteria bacterium]
MDLIPPNFKDILSGILLLAAREDECITVREIHSIFHEMKAHEPILSGLRFSLTGDVCYSRTVDSAIKNLIDSGSLRIEGETAVVCGGIHEYRTYLSRSFTNPQIQAIHSASLRFYDRMRRGDRGIADIGTACGRTQGKAGLH